MELELVLMGHGLGQLLSGREADPEAGLPGGHKGWAALPGMTEVSVSAEEEAMEALLAAGHAFLLTVEAMDYSSLRARLDACDRVLVL